MLIQFIKTQGLFLVNQKGAGHTIYWGVACQNSDSTLDIVLNPWRFFQKNLTASKKG